MWKSKLSCFCLGVLTLVSLGCGLPAEPVWTPDSKSFLFTKSDGSLVQYDLGKQASRTLFELAGSRPRRAALSPDGKMVAVAVASWGEESVMYGLQLHHLPSGQLADSQVHKRGEQSKPRTFRDSSAYWCPSGERIVICYFAGKESDKQETVVYHLKQKQFRTLTGRPPAVFHGAAFGFSPLRPDGAGYLAIEFVNNQLEVAFIDWEGWERKIALAPELQSFFQTAGGGNIADAEKREFITPVPQARWEGNVLTFSLAGSIVRIDTEKQVATYTKDAREAAKYQEFLAEEVFDYRDFPDDRYRVQRTYSSDTVRLELVEPGKQRRKTLVEGINMTFPSSVLSPNGRYMLVPIEKGKQSMIWVIRNDGEIVAKLDANGA